MSDRTADSEFAPIQCALCHRWYGAITHTHLRSAHGWLGEVSRYKTRFAITYVCSSRTRNRMRARPKRVWSATERNNLSAAQIEHHNLMGRKWSVRAVLKAIQARGEAGRLMYSGIVRNDDPALHGAATRYCGCWGAACRAAKIKEEKYRKCPPWRRERVVAWIKMRTKANKPVYQQAALDADHRVVGAASKCIGKWSEALKVSGVPKKDRFMPRKMIRTEAWVIENIRELYRNGQPLIGRSVPANLRVGGRNRFGGWHVALKAAGIPQEHFAPWTKERVISYIRARLKAQKPVHYSAIKSEDPRMISRAKWRIGRWSEALKLAGVPKSEWFMSRIRRTKEWVVENITARYLNGESLSCERVPRSLEAAGRSRFGRWRLALSAAGIPLDHRVK